MATGNVHISINGVPTPPAPYATWWQMYMIGVGWCFHLTNPATFKHGDAEYSWQTIKDNALRELMDLRLTQREFDQLDGGAAQGVGLQ